LAAAVTSPSELGKRRRRFRSRMRRRRRRRDFNQIVMSKNRVSALILALYHPVYRVALSKCDQRPLGVEDVVGHLAYNSASRLE